MCPLVIASPNKKDNVKIKDENGETVEVRKFFYMFSIREVYASAIQDPLDGGFVGFRDKDNKVWISASSMERMLPDNLRLQASRWLS